VDNLESAPESTSELLPKVNIFFSGDEYFQAALSDIKTAKKEVLLESYIFHFDPIGIQFLQALSDAKKRGVHVCLVIDGIGSYNWIEKVITWCEDHDVPLRIFHPLPKTIDRLVRKKWRTLRRWLRIFQRSNKRNHRKTIVIDSCVAYVGSFNISQVHSEHYMEDLAWRDTGVRIESSSVQSLRDSFLEIWKNIRRPWGVGLLVRMVRWKKRVRSKSNTRGLFRMNTHYRYRMSLLRDLKKRLETAQNEVLITNPYFLPRRSFLRHLRKASKRGVQVKIMLPAVSDVPVVQWATESLYFKLLRDGVHIYEYQGRMLHAKTLLIDNWCTIGSHNLNHRSFLHDLEVEVALSDSDSIVLLKNQWEKDLEKCKKIEKHHLGQFSLVRRLRSQFAYWWRYWL
jgi:cardiolipin synthase